MLDNFSLSIKIYTILKFNNPFIILLSPVGRLRLRKFNFLESYRTIYLRQEKPKAFYKYSVTLSQLHQLCPN